MNLCKKRGVHPSELSLEDFIQSFEDPEQFRANNYSRLVEKISSVFGPENILVLFLDELICDSAGFYNKLVNFLGIRYVDMDGRKSFDKHANKGLDSGMPRDIEKYLYQIHKKHLEEMLESENLRKYAQTWYDKGSVFY